MFSPGFWEAVGEGNWAKEEGRKGRQNAHYTQALSISFFHLFISVCD